MPRNRFPCGAAVSLLKEFHVALAFITVAGFAVRGLLSLAESPLRNRT